MIQVVQVSLHEEDVRWLLQVIEQARDDDTLSPPCRQVACDLTTIFWSFRSQLEDATYRGQRLRLFMGVQPVEED